MEVMSEWANGGEKELAKALAEVFKRGAPPSKRRIDPICRVAVTYMKVSGFGRARLEVT